MYLRIEELVPTTYHPYFTGGIHDSNMQQAATNNIKNPLLSTQAEQPTDLTNIKENNSAYNIIKEEEQLEKSIVINNEEVIDFVKIAKGTFGIFRVKTEDNRIKERYFLMYIVF